jgi:hypothetical protein
MDAVSTGQVSSAMLATWRLAMGRQRFAFISGFPRKERQSSGSRRRRNNSAKIRVYEMKSMSGCISTTASFEKRIYRSRRMTLKKPRARIGPDPPAACSLMGQLFPFSVIGAIFD